MLVAVISTVLVAVFIRVTSTDRLTQLVIDQQRSRLETVLKNYYLTYGSWDQLQDVWLQIQYQVVPNQLPGADNALPTGLNDPVFRDRTSMFSLADADGYLIISTDPGQKAGVKAPANLLEEGYGIVINDEKVGTLLVSKKWSGFNPEEALFLERTNQALVLSLGGALLLALIIGTVLARTLTKPLRALTQAAENITQGDLEQQVEVNSKDEIGQLATAFNTMSSEVALSNQMRRQMTADVAHDLRTPLTVAAGYVESMRDGVLQPTTQRLTLVYSELERLQTLVNDLRVISMADSGELPLNPQRISPNALINHAGELFEHHAEQNQVLVIVAAEKDPPDIWIDEARMMQVLDNLLSNSLRYTPAGGKITLSARQEDTHVLLSIADTGSGIDPEDLPFIFNRFSRADKSRHTENGESGLGLSIVKAIVNSHHGRVWAESAPDQGTTIFIELPTADSLGK